MSVRGIKAQDIGIQ